MGNLASAYYKDFVMYSSMSVNSPLEIHIGPTNETTRTTNAILNGFGGLENEQYFC